MTDSHAQRDAFLKSFRSWARRVRTRVAVRRAAAGAAIALALAVGLVALFWYLRLGELRIYVLALPAVGALLGVVHARLRGFSDADIALYLDARLGTHEIVSTALGFAGLSSVTGSANDDASTQTVIAGATRALAEAAQGSGRNKVRLRVLKPWQAWLPVGTAAAVWLCVVQLPAAPKTPVKPVGAKLLQAHNVKGLEKIIALEKVHTHDAAQRERLKGIADRARALKEKLRTGIEQREALAELGKLEEDIAAERLRFTDREHRAGLEAAIAALEKVPSLQPSARALGNGDLTQFDQSMRELANQVERSDRDAAKKALEEAEKAARSGGAKQLADALKEQQRLLDERSGRAQALRELGEAMKQQLSQEALDDLEEFGKSGSPEASKRLSDSLADALNKLSEEERKRLAERLGKRLKSPGSSESMSAKELEEYAKRLGTPEGKKELERQLRELGKDSSESEERERALGDAERGGNEAERSLGGGAPVPIPGSGEGTNPGTGQSGKDGDPGGNHAQGGPSKGGGHADHTGQTQKLNGKELRAKAEARLNPGIPLHAAEEGRAAARPGETANQQGVGALGSVGSAEVGAVEQSSVPEEYREQVGRYFEP